MGREEEVEGGSPGDPVRQRIPGERILLTRGARGGDQRGSSQGTERDADRYAVGVCLAKAVVQLKNLKTLQVKSFYTDDQGGYRFHGLDPDQDYELKAEFGNATSGTKKVTSFDSRREVVINFKLDVQKQ